MSYYPYFRGKQFELISVRENAEIIGQKKFTPIIEPVRESEGSIVRAIDALKLHDSSIFLVANPRVGQLSSGLPDSLVDGIEAATDGYGHFAWLVQLGGAEDLTELRRWSARKNNIAYLHHGALSARDVLSEIGPDDIHDQIHIFTDGCSARYRGSFNSKEKILLSDGFKKRRNADHPEVELFSEMSVTFRELGGTGFGDYLIVGSDYSEGGGAAYAVAIHLTYPNPDDDGVIYVRHFISDTNNTPTDPAGKFSEALGKLSNYITSAACQIPRTRAVEEFLRLHEFGHYPGLGYVKKLSIQHHLEIMG